MRLREPQNQWRTYHEKAATPVTQSMQQLRIAILRTGNRHLRIINISNTME
ncbi:hypothetical protein RvY_09048 [Ramazzottius varieornatus]|uniref:Uncharacterized protein n=1 Tax=Ramazzottius varieornatus TaxID=947166 RepID=A0A1D1VDK6_RAMVA|nr:hypothetical protein RvY_09048 [Ramazzottius varieornatus]